MAKPKSKPPRVISQLVRALARQAAHDYFRIEQQYTQAANDNCEDAPDPPDRLDCPRVPSVNDHDPGDI